jgi:hypothetical protein
MSILAMLCLLFGLIVFHVNGYGIRLRTGVKTIATSDTTAANIFGVVITFGIQFRRFNKHMHRTGSNTQSTSLAFVRIHLGSRIFNIGQRETSLLSLYIVTYN